MVAAKKADRYGTALLALNTNRPADLERGAQIVHFDLETPPTVLAEIALWDTGSRESLSPREAAQFLWTVPAATFLDGRLDAWRDLPGVNLLLPGLARLAATPQKRWPTSQQELQDLVAAEAPGNLSRDGLVRELETAGTVDLLNDLVLLFKFAAIGRQRPVLTAAELYRLARTVTARRRAPGTQAEIVAWLSAPLVVHPAFTGPLERRGPQPPAPSQGNGSDSGASDLPVGPPVLPHFDLSSPRAQAAIRLLEQELSDRERLEEASALSNALRDAGVRVPELLSRVARIAAGRNVDARELDVVRPSAVEQPYPALNRPPKKVVRTYIAGFPVLVDLAEVEARMTRRRHMVGVALAEALPQSLQTRLAGLSLSLEDLYIWPDLLEAATPSPSFLKPVGRSDLLLVRQTTTGYRRAEIAFVENILVGESRQREHTNRVLTRQEFFESLDRETEETRDLQVTDRAELSREVNRVVKEDLRAEGSVEVTSRGPTKVVASATVSFERATEEAAKNAEAYSRETVERAVNRTLEKVRREVRTLFEQETVETNRHSFERDATAPDHVFGVYQYLERISRAKMFWYGERELYDILVPEPAALIWHLAISRDELHIPLKAPDVELFDKLTAANIGEFMEDVIRAFRVTDLPPVPDPTKTVSLTFSATGGGDDAKYATHKDLQVPAGYEVTDGIFVISAEVEGEEDFTPNGGVVVGTDVKLWEAPVTGNRGEANLNFTFVPGLSGPTVAVAVNVDNFRSLAGSVTLNLQLTGEARHGWGLEAYGRVSERFEQLRLEYEQAVLQSTAIEPDEEVTLPEGSRLWLQQLVRSEIQRSAVDIVCNQTVDYDLITDYWSSGADGSPPHSYPVANLPVLRATEPTVRFLQQAFEWEHLSWILYPYYWGRRSEWSKTVVQSHPDPDFSAFLNAGAARVQLPVRPGFEEMVKHFMETGEVYEGGGLPSIGDPGYVPFIDEQLTTLGAPGDEIPWPPDAPREWDVVAPTSLVVIRSLTEAQLPVWDPASGDEL